MWRRDKDQNLYAQATGGGEASLARALTVVAGVVLVGGGVQAAKAEQYVTPPPQTSVAVLPPPLSPEEEVEARFQRADNFVEFYDRAALGRFFLNWANRSSEPPVIAHFGDSHVQLGWLVSPLRERFQRARGNGGRGMIFPYSIAKTYSQEDYRSSFTGVWRTANSIQQPPRLPVGVSGFVAVTNDASASFTIDFTKPQASGQQNVHLYVKVIDATYQVTLENGGALQTREIKPDPAAVVQTASFTLQTLAPHMVVTINRKDPAPAADSPNVPSNEATLRTPSLSAGQPNAIAVGATAGTVRDLSQNPPVEPAIPGQFEIYGIDLRTVSGGVVYHNLGVGGANFNALLQQRFFVEHYKLLKPDLVILDWGTNDIIYKNAVAPDHARKVIRTIQRIRAVDPHVSILLTSVQDMNYRRRNVTAAAEYAKVMREIAREQNCLFFDWYRTSGGPDTMRFWSAAKLSSKDNIHLNGRGYRKRGEALADALFATLNAIEVTPSLTSLVRAAAPENSSGLLLPQTEIKTPSD